LLGNPSGHVLHNLDLRPLIRGCGLSVGPV
jgi:hypothetical protein